MPAPISTALIAWGAVFTTVSPVGGAIAAGAGLLCEVFFAAIAGVRNDDEFLG